ncbi:MAG TPA: hypothetical protein DEB09_02975 [Candidatus Magasanikbacteria bacterium]|nr:hypothetical protein [Candidatus Magasanikbacteria bacterium]
MLKQNKIITHLKEWLPLYLIFIFASFLRLHLLLLRDTFWFDEMFSVHFANLPWADAIKYWTLETNPPLYTLFLRGWTSIVGINNELLIRLPSTILGLATIVLLYYFTYKIINKKAAIISSLTLTLSGVHIFINSEARVYSLMIFLTLLSYFLFYQIFFNGKNKLSVWLIYFFINLLLIYSHLTALSIFVTQFLSLFLLNVEKKEFRYWFFGHVLIGASWLIWFVPSLLSKLNQNSLSAWYFRPVTTAYANVLTLLVSIFMNEDLTPFVFTTFGIILIGAIVFTILKTKNETDLKQKRLLIFLQLWAFLLIFSGSIIGVFVTKFYVISSLPLYIILGYSVSRAVKNTKIFYAIIIFIILLITPGAYTVSNSGIFSWTKLINYIETNETKNSFTIITPFNEVLPLQKYYHGQRPIVGIYLREDNFSLEERIVRYNWNQQITDKPELTKWLEQYLKTADKIFYIQYTDNFDWMHQIFVEHGWTLEHKQRANGYVDLYLFEFHAPNYSTTSTISTKK